MSALPPKADMCGATRDVRFVPIADIGDLFDHLVGAALHRLWHGNAERLGGLEIDDQLDFRWLLDWQVGRLLALENSAGVNAGQAVVFRFIASIAHQAAGRDERAILVDRRYRVTER